MLKLSKDAYSLISYSLLYFESISALFWLSSSLRSLLLFPSH